VQKNVKLEPQKLLEAIFQDVREFAHGAAQSDDITAMVLRYGEAYGTLRP
jgi:serine phosphatase RsbU (regulator of sigma subunit)